MNIKKALLAFMITFCAPAIIANSYQSYSAVGAKLGQKIYEVTHDENN